MPNSGGVFYDVAHRHKRDALVCSQRDVEIEFCL